VHRSGRLRELGLPGRSVRAGAGSDMIPSWITLELPVRQSPESPRATVRGQLVSCDNIHSLGSCRVQAEEQQSCDGYPT